MRIKPKRRRQGYVVVLHLWWLWLSAGYLTQYWRHPVPAGADGAGHVAALHLYGKYVYPDVQGWLPELFGGMPFPVFYPPLFYWLGATLMKVTGCAAPTAAKLLTTLSFAALPGALYYVGRRLGLSSAAAAAAGGFAGVLACGANAAALGGIGLLGLFEVGLYTQTLGFVWFCFWCGSLPHAHRSRRAALTAVAALAATVLTNVHLLPLVAAYGGCWWLVRAWRLRRAGLTRRRWLLSLGQPAALALCSVLLAAGWLVPLIVWYRFSLGEPLPAPRLLAVLGVMNFAWPVCAFVAWSERRRRPALAALCVALLLAALAALTPVGAAMPFIPLQAWRLMSSALILATIPGTLLLLRVLRELVGERRWVVSALLLLGPVGADYIHTRQSFGSAALSAEEGSRIERLTSAVAALPPGMILAEIVEPSVAFGLRGGATQEMMRARALLGSITMSGRPVLWCVFREQAMSAPMATAASNLFSTSKEHFGLDGQAMRQSQAEPLAPDAALRLARSMGVNYYLIRTPEQAARLGSNPEVRLVWSIEGWHLFVNEPAGAERFEVVRTTPVLAWLAARTKSRAADALDLYNLGEALAFAGREDLCVIWAQSPGGDVGGLLAEVPSAVVVVDPAAVSERERRRLAAALREHGGKLGVVLFDDGSQFAAQIHAGCASYAGCVRVPAGKEVPQESLLGEAEKQILKMQSLLPASFDGAPRLWRTSMAYFPTWHTAGGDPVWVTGRGGMAALGQARPSLQWRRPWFSLAAWALSALGLCAAVLSIFFYPSRGRPLPRPGHLP